MDKEDARDRPARRCAAATRAERMTRAGDSRPYYGGRVVLSLRRYFIARSGMYASTLALLALGDARHYVSFVVLHNDLSTAICLRRDVAEFAPELHVDLVF